MLLGTLGASLLENLLTSKGTIREDEGTIRGGENFYCHLILYLLLKYKNIIKMNLNLMMFIEEIIFLNCKMGHI